MDPRLLAPDEETKALVDDFLAAQPEDPGTPPVTAPLAGGVISTSSDIPQRRLTMLDFADLWSEPHLTPEACRARCSNSDRSAVCRTD
jgi:hypothetical protein